MKKLFILIAFLFSSFSLLAEPVETTLQDYAFDFTEIGYDIIFVANVLHFGNSTPTDTFLVQSDGYNVSMKIDRLSRKGKRDFTKYVNKNCEAGPGGSSCTVKVSGEVSLNREFKIVIWARTIAFMERDLRTVIGTYE